MATNRFDKFLNTNYRTDYLVPQLELPDLGLMKEALAKKEQELLQSQALASKVPDHHQLDTQAARDIVSEYEQSFDDIASTYQKGDWDSAYQKRIGLTRKAIKDYGPGGRANALLQRKKKYNELQSDLQKRYLDPKSKDYAPQFYDYYMKQVTMPDWDYQDGRFSMPDGPTGVDIYSNKEVEEKTKRIFDMLESDRTAYVSAKGQATSVPLYQLMTQGKTEYLNLPKIYQALHGGFANDPSMLNYFSEAERVYGIGDGTQPLVNSAYDSKRGSGINNSFFNRQSLLGNMLEGFARGKSFVKQDVSGRYILDQVAADRATEDYKYTLGREEYRQDLAGANTGMTGASAIRSAGHTSLPKVVAGMMSLGLKPISAGKAEDILALSQEYAKEGRQRDFWKTDEANEIAPGVKDLAWKLDRNFQGTDEEYQEELANMYERKRKALQTTSIGFQSFGDEEKKDVHDRMIKLNEWERLSYFEITPGSQNNIPMSAGEMVENLDYGTLNAESRKQVEDSFSLNGRIIDNSEFSQLPNGTQVTITDNEGKPRTFIATTESVQKMQTFAPYRQLMAPQRDGSQGDIATSEIVPIETPDGTLYVRSQFEDYWEDDMIKDQIRNAGKDTKKYQEGMKRLAEIEAKGGAEFIQRDLSRLQAYELDEDGNYVPSDVKYGEEAKMLLNAIRLGTIQDWDEQSGSTNKDLKRTP